MKIRNRIRELRVVKGSELKPNPKNWRTHSREQADAMRGLLAELGFVGASLARELDDGSLMLIDGHLRSDVAANADIPVLILDVTDDEADKILATFDRVTGMAGTDEAALSRLVDELEFSSDAISAMFDELREQTPPIEGKTTSTADAADDDESDDEEEAPAAAGDEPTPRKYKYAVVVECEDEEEQLTINDVLTEQGYTCHTETK